MAKWQRMPASTSVALRKESVDRNDNTLDESDKAAVVALRKESVDRNSMTLAKELYTLSRSPQGERG